MRTAIAITVLLSTLLAALFFSVGLGVSFLHAFLVIIAVRFAIVAVTFNGVQGGTYGSHIPPEMIRKLK